MSQNIGRAPVRAMVPAVAKKVYGLVMTSCPATDVQRHQRQQQRIRARGDADAELALAVGRDVLLELRDLGAEDEALAGADLFDGREGLGPSSWRTAASDPAGVLAWWTSLSRWQSVGASLIDWHPLHTSVAGRNFLPQAAALAGLVDEFQEGLVCLLLLRRGA